MSCEKMRIIVIQRVSTRAVDHGCMPERCLCCGPQEGRNALRIVFESLSGEQLREGLLGSGDSNTNRIEKGLGCCFDYFVRQILESKARRLRRKACRKSGICQVFVGQSDNPCFSPLRF
jgi:hypothetical protein